MALRTVFACVAAASSPLLVLGDGSAGFLERPMPEAEVAANVTAANVTAAVALSAAPASCSCCHHEEKISDVWASCSAPQNRGCRSCSLFHAVFSHPKCGGSVAIVGEKICPVAALGGSEGITKATAAAFESVWSCAAHKTGSSPNMGLIVNPWKARTQHHLHVKTMPLDSRGMALARRLEKITKCRTGKWHSAHFKCPFSKVQLFSSMPAVFSKVVAYASTGALGRMLTNPAGDATLANIGITVLFICDGKPAVLAHGDSRGYCSIEHSIYSR